MSLSRATPIPFEKQAPLQLLRFIHIGLGAIILWRALSIALPGIWYWEVEERGWLLAACAFYGLLGALLASGRLGSWPLLVLVCVHVPLSVVFRAMNLGPQMMQALMLALVVSGPSKGFIPDFNTGRRLHLVRWALFLCVAVNHFSAAMMHGTDPYWTSGQTVHALMTNSYMFKSSLTVQNVLLWAPNFAPWLLSKVSCIGLILQVIWQMGMVPMALSRKPWLVAFVKWYGWFFILFSFGLSLSVLPVSECLLWLYLFGPPICPNWKGWSGPAPTFQPIRAPLTRSLITGWCWASVLYAGLHILPASRGAMSQPAIWDVTRCFGLWAPNVFNEHDLRMGDCWLTFEAQSGSQARRMLPFNDTKGRRGWWLWSDILYYGNSLGQRRGVIGMDPYEYFGDVQGGGLAVLRLLQFDRRLHPEPADVVYTVTLNRSKASKVALPPDQRFKISRKPLLKITLHEGRVSTAELGSDKLKAMETALLGRDLAQIFTLALPLK
jgi:hypothetical protein